MHNNSNLNGGMEMNFTSTTRLAPNEVEAITMRKMAIIFPKPIIGSSSAALYRSMILFYLYF